MELACLPSLKTVLTYLGKLAAFRPIMNASENQSRIILDDISRNIISEEFSETALVWAIEKLIDGNSEFGGRNFPTRGEIMSEIRLYDAKIKLIIKAYEAGHTEIPPGYHMDRQLDWIFDETRKTENNFT